MQWRSHYKGWNRLSCRGCCRLNRIGSSHGCFRASLHIWLLASTGSHKCGAVQGTADRLAEDSHIYSLTGFQNTPPPLPSPSPGLRKGLKTARLLAKLLIKKTQMAKEKIHHFNWPKRKQSPKLPRDKLPMDVFPVPVASGIRGIFNRKKEKKNIPGLFTVTN